MKQSSLFSVLEHGKAKNFHAKLYFFCQLTNNAEKDSIYKQQKPVNFVESEKNVEKLSTAKKQQFLFALSNNFHPQKNKAMIKQQLALILINSLSSKKL